MEKQESETTIRFSKDLTDPISVFTCDENFKDRLVKLGLSPYRIDRVDGRDCAWSFKAPRNWIVKIRPKRKISENEAQIRRKTLALARSRKIHVGLEAAEKLGSSL